MARAATLPITFGGWVGRNIRAEHRAHQWALAALGFGIVLRLALTVLNAQANDDHFEVIAMMAFEGRTPGVHDAWEGFQPKLYHATVAAIWQLMPEVRWGIYVRVAQLVACSAGVATLLLLWRFLLELPVRPSVRLVTMSLLALNPKLIGMHVQATNDAFAVLFCTLALYAMWWFFQSRRPRYFVVTLLTITLGVLSKGNALAVATAIVCMLACAPLLARVSSLHQRIGPVLALAVVLLILQAGWLSEYGRSYREHGTPFATNMDHSPFPAVFERSEHLRPGVRSIVDGLLTFRLIDMLQTPITWGAEEGYPEHRTSLWSQVHGRAHSVHFDGHPGSWRTWEPEVLWLTRVIIVLALPLSAFMVFSFAAGVVRCAWYWLHRKTMSSRLHEMLLVLAAGGQVAFLVVYCLRVRDFSCMKAIFLAPAILPFVWLFAQSADRAAGWLDRHPRLRWAASVWLIALLLAYVTDIGVLIEDLAR